MPGRAGLAVEVVHSDGGWGSRREDVKFQDEVCNECKRLALHHLKTAWDEFKESRAGKNKSFIVVTDPLGRTDVK